MTDSLNRRNLLISAGAAAVIPTIARATPEAILKSIPSTGERVPAIGMGSWLTFDVGDHEHARAVRVEVLRRFFERGGSVIDSSPMYGSSQSVIGHALRQLDQPAHFSADKVWIDGGANGPEQIERSRSRWDIPAFDLLQVHNLRDWRAHFETLLEMKANGQIRYVGVTSYAGLRYGDIAAIMENHPIDFIQITYNIVDRDAERRLFPLAREHAVAVIANRPFREGALINTAKRRQLPALARDIGAENWAQFLLKFIISHPAITVAIPATRRVDHMDENMGALYGPLPDATFRRRMIAAFNETD